MAKRLNYTQVDTANPIGIESAYAGRTAPAGWLLEYGQAISRTTYALLFNVICPSIGTFTVTIATPGVVTLTAHGLVTGDQIYITTTGALPTGLTANTLYYVIYIDANTVRLATTRANALVPTPINTTGSQSGVHTMFFCPYGLGDGSTTFNLPDRRGRVAAGSDAMGGTAASRLTGPTTTANTTFGQQGAAGGSQSHTILTAELAAHTHTIYPSTSDGNVIAGGSGGSTAALAQTAAAFRVYSNPISSSTGSDTAHNNTQPTLVSNYIIKAL